MRWLLHQPEDRWRPQKGVLSAPTAVLYFITTGPIRKRARQSRRCRRRSGPPARDGDPEHRRVDRDPETLLRPARALGASRWDTMGGINCAYGGDLRDAAENQTPRPAGKVAVVSTVRHIERRPPPVRLKRRVEVPRRVERMGRLGSENNACDGSPRGCSCGQAHWGPGAPGRRQAAREAGVFLFVGHGGLVCGGHGVDVSPSSADLGRARLVDEKLSSNPPLWADATTERRTGGSAACFVDAGHAHSGRRGGGVPRPETR